MNTVTANTVGILTPIWEHILRRSPIGPEENFFDLGGNAVLALQLSEAIAKVCGQDMPAEAISRAPTIAALAAVIEQPTLPRFSTLVPLKPGSKEPPVFLVHGLDGALMKLGRMARLLSTAHSIVGIQAPGLDGRPPLDRVEDMAELYVKAIRERQSAGPYFLIGYSLGGMIAFEIARRLAVGGEQIALLAMLDAYPHLRQLSPSQRVRVVFQRAIRHLVEMSHMSPRTAFSYVWQRVRKRLGLSKGNAEPGRQEARPSSAELVRSVYEKGAAALARYQPTGVYPGAVKFVRSESTSWFPKDPTPVWEKFVQRFECESVPGDHLSMLSDHFEAAAALLSRYIDEASAQAPQITSPQPK
ncbi:MAG TPA: alpha/beta fold hydrolase [Candidatus Nitrosotalea sp.]|nr:alpha/beta fold hydrolase [Candidatus Nitrosotalea sp.]